MQSITYILLLHLNPPKPYRSSMHHSNPHVQTLRRWRRDGLLPFLSTDQATNSSEVITRAFSTGQRFKFGQPPSFLQFSSSTLIRTTATFFCQASLQIRKGKYRCTSTVAWKSAFLFFRPFLILLSFFLWTVSFSWTFNCEQNIYFSKGNVRKDFLICAYRA